MGILIKDYDYYCCFFFFFVVVVVVVCFSFLVFTIQCNTLTTDYNAVLILLTKQFLNYLQYNIKTT